MHGCVGSGGGGAWVVAMHWPPQGFVLTQEEVGVQIAFLGQGALLPTVQGVVGVGGVVVRQRPLSGGRTV